jgi:hypothetical protein
MEAQLWNPHRCRYQEEYPEYPIIPKLRHTQGQKEITDKGYPYSQGKEPPLIEVQKPEP